MDYKTRNQLEKLSWIGLQAELKRLDRQANKINRALIAYEGGDYAHEDRDYFAAIDERTKWTKANRLAQEVELDHEDEREDREKLIGEVIHLVGSGKSAGWNRYEVVGIGTEAGILIVQRKRVDGGLQATKERMPLDWFDLKGRPLSESVTSDHLRAW
jgi:hypothetical protein